MTRYYIPPPSVFGDSLTHTHRGSRTGCADETHVFTHSHETSLAHMARMTATCQLQCSGALRKIAACCGKGKQTLASHKSGVTGGERKKRTRCCLSNIQLRVTVTSGFTANQTILRGNIYVYTYCSINISHRIHFEANSIM